jgi:hypothetical protein
VTHQRNRSFSLVIERFLHRPDFFIRFQIFVWLNHFIKPGVSIFFRSYIYVGVLKSTGRISWYLCKLQPEFLVDFSNRTCLRSYFFFFITIDSGSRLSICRRVDVYRLYFDGGSRLPLHFCFIIIYDWARIIIF